MQVVCFIQCRSASTRLPGKCFKKIGGQSIIARCYRRCAEVVNNVVVLTPEDDDCLHRHLRTYGIPYDTGHETNVLERFFAAAKSREADYIIRVTGDCPHPSKDALLRVQHVVHNYPDVDFVSNCFPPRRIIDGDDVECMSFNLLSYMHFLQAGDSEHVTKRLYDVLKPDGKRVINIADCVVDLSGHKTSIDTEEDYLRVKEMMERGQRK